MLAKELKGTARDELFGLRIEELNAAGGCILSADTTIASKPLPEVVFFRSLGMRAITIDLNGKIGVFSASTVK